MSWINKRVWLCMHFVLPKNPWHHLSLLKQKPGALRNGESFFGWKLPESIKTLQSYLLKKPKGDRAMG